MKIVNFMMEHGGEDLRASGFNLFMAFLKTSGRVFLSVIVFMGIDLSLHEVFHKLYWEWVIGGEGGRIVFLPQWTEPSLFLPSNTIMGLKPFGVFIPSPNIAEISISGANIFFLYAAGGLGAGIFFLLLAYFLCKKKIHWEYPLVTGAMATGSIIYGLLEPLYYYPRMFFTP